MPPYFCVLSCYFPTYILVIRLPEPICLSLSCSLYPSPLNVEFTSISNCLDYRVWTTLRQQSIYMTKAASLASTAPLISVLQHLDKLTDTPHSCFVPPFFILYKVASVLPRMPSLSSWALLYVFNYLLERVKYHCKKSITVITHQLLKWHSENSRLLLQVIMVGSYVEESEICWRFVVSGVSAHRPLIQILSETELSTFLTCSRWSLSINQFYFEKSSPIKWDIFIGCIWLVGGFHYCQLYYWLKEMCVSCLDSFWVETVGFKLKHESDPSYEKHNIFLNSWRDFGYWEMFL